MDIIDNLMFQPVRFNCYATVTGNTRPSSGSSGSSGGSSGGGVGSSPRSNGIVNGSATLGRNNGLAGLFAQGMPKLKPTGVDIGELFYHIHLP